jgi:hypothetical protein
MIPFTTGLSGSDQLETRLALRLRPEGLHDLLLKQFEDWYMELQDEADGFLD